MASKSNLLTFKIKSTSNLISFLKRFSSVEKSLLLEITPTNVLAKTNTPDRATIKYSTIAITNVLEPKGQLPGDLLKIGIMDVTKLCNSFKHFNDGDEIFLDLVYDKIGDDFVGIEMQVYTDGLKINFICQDISLLTYISRDAFKRIVKTVVDDKVVEFPFAREYFSKIHSLCGLDTNEDHVKLKVNDQGKVSVKSKSFEYNLLECETTSPIELTFKNKQFSYIDEETSKFVLSNNSMLVQTVEEGVDIILILGRQE